MEKQVYREYYDTIKNKNKKQNKHKRRTKTQAQTNDITLDKKGKKN